MGMCQWMALAERMAVLLLAAIIIMWVGQDSARRRF